MSAYIPVIDLRAPHQEVAATIDAAARESGFLVVTGHGIDPDLIQRMHDVTLELFRQPADWKQRWRPPADVAGLTIAVGSGTNQEKILLTWDEQNQAAGLDPVEVQYFENDGDTTLALQSGRADVVLADSPVNAYAAKQSNGQFAIVGQVYGTAPYGIAVPKGGKYAGFADALKLALDDLKTKGVYDQIMQKWGITAGAISNFTVNGAVS